MRLMGAGMVTLAVVPWLGISPAAASAHGHKSAAAHSPAAQTQKSHANKPAAKKPAAKKAHTDRADGTKSAPRAKKSAAHQKSAGPAKHRRSGTKAASGP